MGVGEGRGRDGTGLSWVRESPGGVGGACPAPPRPRWAGGSSGLREGLGRAGGAREPCLGLGSGRTRRVAVSGRTGRSFVQL